MKVSRPTMLFAASAFAFGLLFALSAQAQDSRSEDRVRHFQMHMIDADKDGMVSKKEFLDSVSKAWDMQMADMAKASPPKARDRMTLEQYREFAKMFGLDIGN